VIFLKKKKRSDEVSRKKKRREYHDEESSDYEESSSREFVDIEEDLHEILIAALEDEDWSVSDVVNLLCNEMKYIVGNYE
jgi:ribosome-binding protein aMBF1 (putative translation factor)